METLTEVKSLPLLHHAPRVDFMLAANTPVWIFAGDEGIGKATAAMHAAARLLKIADADEGDSQALFAGDSSTANGAAVDIEAGLAIHPDMLLIRPSQEGSSLRKTISVDQIREMAAFLSKTTVRGGWRVVVVDALDDVTINGANAMLKMLEEPPSKTTIMLISHTPGSILPTIRSRCRLLRFDRLTDDATRTILTQLYPEMDGGHAETMLGFAEGSPGRAVLMIETKSVELYGDTCQALAAETPDWLLLDRVASAWGVAGVPNRKRRRLGLLLFDRLLSLAAKGGTSTSPAEQAAIAALQTRHSPIVLADRHSQFLADFHGAELLNTASQPIFLRLLGDLVETN